MLESLFYRSTPYPWKGQHLKRRLQFTKRIRTKHSLSLTEDLKFVIFLQNLNIWKEISFFLEADNPPSPVTTLNNAMGEFSMKQYAFFLMFKMVHSIYGQKF